MSALKNSVLLRNRKAENRPLMKVICSLLLLAPCLSALMISCCKYFLITVKLRGGTNLVLIFYTCRHGVLNGAALLYQKTKFFIHKDFKLILGVTLCTQKR